MSIDKVVATGLCIGCGVCTIAARRITMVMSPDGRMVAEGTAGADAAGAVNPDLVCPFSDAARNEWELARPLYSERCHHFDEHLGWWLSAYVGHVSDESLRRQASSGGIGRWLLCQLLMRGLVDGCVHVTAGDSDIAGAPLFRFTVSRTADQLAASARSAYYPVEMAGVLRHLLDTPGRYAITGVPCFIKAVRLLQHAVPALAQRIAFTVGLFCGHLKSRLYAEMLGWQLGIPPWDLRWVDFRDKSASKTAKDKGVMATGFRSTALMGPTVVGDLFGADYGLGFFQYPACDYCDDVAAETADVVIGDAWLPEYVADPKGTSIVLVRDREIDGILRDGMSEGELRLHPIDPDKIVESQAGAFRHRREGLAYRLWLDERAGRWHPPKRVAPQRSHLSRLRRQIYRLRIRLREESTRAFLQAKQAGDFAVFRRAMEPLVSQYRRLYRPTLVQRGIRKVRHILRRLCGTKR